ncbi:MAG TPA: NFACT RNA binding domain-containing protein [Candidatus Cybelea sp.]|jgi:predicted ribosome quality control (RQC) complex YloA/Tae2 family protein|nr:NFACT RNA binding domain-containing protein [Candidatus Cybelea sp.]
MLTDWVLTHRLAGELQERLGGARVDEAGVLSDGRIALALRRRRARELVAIDLFASPPLVTLEPNEDTIAAEAGFARTLARSLEGMTLSAVSARRNDRLVRLTFAARSRFGVGDQFDLYLELVPRFGNVVLVKGERVVAAYKEFAPAQNARRVVQAGAPYALPPLPAQPRTIADVAPTGDLAAPLYVYRRDGELLQAYVAPLTGFDDAAQTREPSLLTLFAELRSAQAVDAGAQRSGRRRQTILKRLGDRERRLREELDALSVKRRHADERQTLRSEGERIFATLYSLDETEREAAKERAAKLFAEYKKLAKSLPHITTRERAIRSALEAIETLGWEAERTADEDLNEVERAVADFGPRRGAAAPRLPVRKRRRAALELRTRHGSRIVVGRSPLENADLTFRIARPNDLWFHAQGIPGAHVVLARDDRTVAPDEDVQLAASLAAFYSRARSAAAVPVDYTLRKHVRKQRAAPPGLVWYTNARTVVVVPKEAPPSGMPPERLT